MIALFLRFYECVQGTSVLSPRKEWSGLGYGKVSHSPFYFIFSLLFPFLFSFLSAQQLHSPVV